MLIRPVLDPPFLVRDGLSTSSCLTALVYTNPGYIESCSDTFCLPVTAKIIPLLDVPNAFTPGKFGVNGVLNVAS